MDNIVIHLFETYRHFYLYDVNSNMVVEIGKILYDKLKQGIYDSDIDKLRKRGLLLERKKFEMRHPFDEQLESVLDRNLKSMTLQVTKNCNLRCKYCVYSGSYSNRVHSNERMSMEVALDAIDFFLEHSIDSESIDLGFYGGEPMLEFPLVKNCIEYMEENKGNKDVKYSLTTNATLLTDDMIDFFKRYGVEVTISLDGPKEIHNSNRITATSGQGSYERVIQSLKKIENRWEQCRTKVNFNSVMSPEYGFGIYSNFFENTNFIKDFSAVVNLPSSTYTSEVKKMSNKFVEEFNYELFKFYFSMVRQDSQIKTTKIVRQHYQRLVDDIHDCLKVEVGDIKYDHHSGPCVVGRHRLFVDTNGKMFPCERVSETSEVMNIGNIYKGFEVKKVRQLLNIGKITESECKKCWAFRFCTICAMKADCGNKLSAEQKLKYCDNVRASVEDQLKDYYTFVEMGYDFERE